MQIFLGLPAWKSISGLVLVSISTHFFTSTISGALLGITDLATVHNDTYMCRAKWYDLGIQLRVDVGTLDCFKVQYSDPGDQLREVLRTWLTTSESPTWVALVEALETSVIKEARLARELQQKYSSQQPPVDGE